MSKPQRKIKTPLTEEQKSIIRLHANSKTTIRELRDKAKADWQKTYQFVLSEGLEAKMNESALARQRAQAKNPSGKIFIVSSKQNWLL